MIRPMHHRPYPDRNNDCRLALEVHVQELLDKAKAAGWGRKEAMATIANLVINFMVADAKNEHTNYSIAQALGRIQH
jgi:hypothetical protein